MKRLPVLAAALVASWVVLAAHPPRADACSPPPAIWVNEPVGEAITGVPVQGVVPIFSENEPGFEDLIVVTVLDAGDQVVAGSVELLRYRLVWRSDAPLAPDATYRMQIEDDWGQVTEVVFVTAEEGAPAPAAPSLEGSVQLGEEVRADEQFCCGSGEIDTCSGEELDHCWAESYTYLPRLSLSLGIDDDARRYAVFTVEASGGEARQQLDAIGVQSADAVFGGRQETYCVTVNATSLLDGSVVSAQRCASDGELQPADPAQPEEPDLSLCGGGDDYDDDEPWDGDDYDDGSPDWLHGDGGGGCAAGGAGGGGGLLGLLALLTVVGPLAARRGRRRPAG